MSPADLWHGFYKTTSSVFTFEDGTSCTSGVYGSVHKAYPWHSREPDSSSPCIRLKYMGSQQFVWADYGCSNTFRFLCQGKFRDIVYWEKSIQIRKTVLIWMYTIIFTYFSAFRTSSFLKWLGKRVSVSILRPIHHHSYHHHHAYYYHHHDYHTRYNHHYWTGDYHQTLVVRGVQRGRKSYWSQRTGNTFISPCKYCKTHRLFSNKCVLMFWKLENEIWFTEYWWIYTEWPKVYFLQVCVQERFTVKVKFPSA